MLQLFRSVVGARSAFGRDHGLVDEPRPFILATDSDASPRDSYAHNFGLGPNTGVLARGPGDRRSAHSLGLRRFSVFRLAAPTRLPAPP